jgi:AcrR family transcriptional regulator
MAQRASERDRETRERLLQAAMRLFAQHGFAKVTVRDICRKARANVAAVNYHFDGKRGLYEEVLETAIRTMQGATDEARAAGRERPPEAQLSTYIAIFLRRVFESRDSWIHQLMMRELADPTPALDLVVDQVIRPRMAYLLGIIAAIIGCPADDPRVMQCAFSVHTQCLAVRDNPVAPRLGFERLTPDRVQVMAAHIATFSVAGIRAVAAR